MPTPRRVRRLAAPIVVTIAAVPACTPEPPPDLHVNPPPQNLNPPPPPTNQPPVVNPPPVPTTIATPTAPIGNPPPPQVHVDPTAKVASDPPLPFAKGRIEQRPDGTCVQYADMSTCPQGAICNPPPPHPVRCPGK